MQSDIPFARALRAFVLLVIWAISLVVPAQAQSEIALLPNPYDPRFIQLKQEFNGASAPHQAVIIAQALGLYEFVDHPDDVRTWFETLVSSSELHPLVRDEAAYRLASIQRSIGDFAQAERTFVSLGFIRDWSIAGPFPAPQGLLAQLAPDRGYHSSDRFAESAGGGGWRHVQELGPQPWLNFNDFFLPAGPSVVYAATAVFSPEPKQVVLRLASDSSLTLVVNGAQVLTDCNFSSAPFDHAVAVNLHEGWNSILVKVASTAFLPRVAVRLTGLRGGGLPLQASGTRDHEPAARAATVASSQPDDLVEMARAAANGSSDAGAGTVLAEIEREHARGPYLEHLQAVARRAPTSERWLALAKSCGDSSCTFAALNAAIKSGPSAEAQLALAEYYTSRNQLDRARDILRQVIAAEPQDFVARTRLAELYLRAGLNARALEEFRTLQRDFPGPLWLKRKLGAHFAQLDLLDTALPLLEATTLRDPSDQAGRNLLAKIYRRRHDAGALTRLWQRAVALNPNDAPAMAKLAEAQLGSGDITGARQTLAAAMNTNSGTGELRQTYSELLERAGDDQGARRELAAALDTNPRLENARQRLRLRSGSLAGDPDSSYLEDVAQQVANARCASMPATTNVTSVSDVRIERVYPSGLSSVRSQQLFCIASEQGARDYATRSVQYSSTQHLTIVHARVHKSGGRVLEAAESGEAGVADANISMYYDIRSRSVRFPGLEKGDVVELEYSIVPTASTNPYGDYFATLVPFRSTMPVALKRFVLIAPANRKLNIVEHAMQQPSDNESTNGDKVYRWEQRDISPLPNEPRGPSLTEVAPYAHASTFASWDDIGRWYAQLIRPQFQLDSELRELVTRLTAGKHSDVEKINAIHQFVLRNTHYLAMEFGIYSYKPYPVTQTFARRFGDCKDKASLMVALLRQAGIEADIALVRTRRLGNVDDRAISIALFNHAIVYVPKWDLWLDGTAEYAGSRELPLDDQGAMALVVGLDGTSSLRKIPVTTADDNYTRRVVTAQVQRDGTISFTGAAYTRGEDAPGLRREYEIAERQRDSFRSSLAEVFPSVQLDDVRVDGATDLERDVQVDFRGALDTFSGRSILALNTSWMARSYVQNLAPLASRTQDLILPAPWTTEEQLRFQLPGGALVSSLPSDRTIDTPFGSARIRYQQHGRELVISTSVRFQKTRITPAEYPAFRDFCRDVERAFRAEVKVSLRQS